jgi:sugar lactone lactonase YvrE
VQRFSPNSLNGTTVANPGGGTTAALTDLKNPTGIAVDNNSNTYIADTGNKRLVVWAPNATSGSILISDNSLGNAYGLVLVPNSPNQVYYSTQGGTNSIYWWTFNASSANVILNQVNTAPNTLNSPGGITLDLYGNLYVTDKNPDRVVMYCRNATGVYSTVGTAVIQATDATLKHPMGVGFDSDLIMYVALNDGNYVVRYSRL